MSLIKDKDKFTNMSDGKSFLLSYFNDSKKVHYCGTHKGEITGKNITVESYLDINELIKRVKELDLYLSEKDAEEIKERAKYKNVNLSKEILTEIDDYVKVKNA